MYVFLTIGWSTGGSGDGQTRMCANVLSMAPLERATVDPPFTWTGRRSAATFQSCTFDHSPAVPSMLVAIIAAQAQMRGSLHAHILVWFRRRELPSNFTNLSPIARDLKTSLPSRQRPRGHEVAPQPGQLKKGEHFHEDNVRCPPCNCLFGP